MSDENAFTPAAGSLAAKVIDYFRQNPEEELTRRDVADKFEIAAASVDTCLKKATDAGYLATKNNDEMVRCWVAGPRISSAKVPAKARKPRETAALAPFDPAAIRIETGVEKPARKNPNSPGYTAVIERMTPGSSVALPSEHAKRLIDFAKKLAKDTGTAAKYSLRKIDDTTSRVWRDA